MYLTSALNGECCGCLVCVDSCPKNCLSFKADDEGFLYPFIIDAKECINCGLCKKICPIINNDRVHFSNQKCAFGWHKDSFTRQSSSSGAAAVAIIQICNDLGYSSYYGARYNDNNEVIHDVVYSDKETACFKESKYVQSLTIGIYNKIRSDINNDKQVVFFGTPCQVTALKNFLTPKEIDHVLTVSIVCHGVASPEIYRKYINETEKKHNSNLKRIKFRDVKTNDGITSYNYTTLFFENNSISSSNEDLYTLMFGLGYINRKSCFNCPFTTINRNADITIGDYWGIEKYYPDLKNEISKGISLIITHSTKGNEIFHILNNYMYLTETPISYAINAKQPQLSKPMKEPKNRHKFIINSLKGSFISNASSEKFKFKIRRRLKTIHNKFQGKNHAKKIL